MERLEREQAWSLIDRGSKLEIRDGPKACERIGGMRTADGGDDLVVVYLTFADIANRNGTA